MSARYAIYFCPGTESELYRRASAWLGYDVATGESLMPELPPGLDRDDWRAGTAAPNPYGFHGTLKAPFRLADGAEAESLRQAVADFAGRCRPFRIDPLELQRMGGFIALVPAGDQTEIAALAAACVAEFDRFRAPPTDAELARRRRSGLTPREDELLRQWGYPHVMELYRFHLTLTDRLPEDRQDRFERLLAERFGPLLEAPLCVESLCLFVQPSEEARFVLRERFPFGA